MKTFGQLSIRLDSQLEERIRKQFERWRVSTWRPPEVTPAFNSFLTFAITVYVENLEDASDEDLKGE